MFQLYNNNEKSLTTITFLIVSLTIQAIDITVGDSYTCDIGFVQTYYQVLDVTYWTISDNNAMEFTSELNATTTRVQVYAKSVCDRVTVHCEYKINEIAPEGRLTRRSEYKYWVFRILAPDPQNVIVTPSSLLLDVGEMRTLSATVYPPSANQEVQWNSSDNQVAWVNRFGDVFANSPGNAVITATTLNGIVGYCNVNVRRIDPVSVSIPQTLDAYVDEDATIIPEVIPSNAWTTLFWNTEDSQVATISNGVVRGKNEGTTSVWCVTANGLRSNDCLVSVSYRTPTGISLSKSSLYLPIDQSSTLTYSLNPSNAHATVTWQSSNDAVAEVTQKGVVKAIAAGSARITVTTDNGYQASCNVTVPPNPTGVSLPNKISLYPGKKRTLKSQIFPSDAYHVLTWKSSDGHVASVGSNGEVLAQKPGTAVIEVKTQNGYTASCTVEVPAPDYQFYVWTGQDEHETFGLGDHPVVTYNDGKLVLNTKSGTVEWPKENVLKFTVRDDGVDPVPSQVSIPTELNIAYKKSEGLKVTLYPEDYDIEDVLTWHSDNADIVVVEPKTSVRDSVVVRAVGVGETDISVTASNGKTAQCHIIVPEPIYYFYVYFNDGTEIHHVLKDKPFVAYHDGVYTVRTIHDTVQYPASDVCRFMLQETEENIMEGSLLSFDVNNDRKVNVMDVLMVVNHILNYEQIGFNPQAADANKDGAINIIDVMTIVNYILNH